MSMPLHRRSLRNALIAAILGTVLVVVAFATEEPGLWLLVAFAGIMLAGIVFVLRRDEWQVFGPVLRYELVRAARQGRTFSLRCLYAAVLLIVLFLVYMQWFGRYGGDPWRFFWDGAKLPIDNLAGFASSFSSSFLAAQLLTVYILTPIFAAGAIAGERERGTLDHLLVTHLHDREIVLGKLASRLAHLTLLVLTGLPVLGLMLFMGGVDPNLVLAGFLATLATMASVGSLGVLNSIRFGSTRQAVIHTYVMVVGYQLMSFPCLGCGCVGEVPAAGNVFLAGYQLFFDGGRSFLGLSHDLPWVASRYTGFHIAVASVCSYLAVRRLRGVQQRLKIKPRRKHALPLPEGPPSRPARPVGAVLVAETLPLATLPAAPHHVILRPQYYREGTTTMRRPRPRPTSHPLLWKELYVESLLPWHGPTRPLASVVFLCVLMATGLVFLVAVLSMLAGEGSGEFANIWTRVVGTSVACALLVGVAVRAAVSFSNERERQTLDGLLATPLDNGTILAAKWLGSILSVRKGWWALAAIWGLGVLSGGLHPFALPVLVGAWAIYAFLLAGVGISCSLASRNTLRATTLTLLIAAGLNVLPWAIGLGWDLLAYAFDFPQNAVGDLAWLAACPPVTLTHLAVVGQPARAPRWPPSHTPGQELAAALLGLILYALAASILWWAIKARFGRITGRMPVV
jgi:ABC-type transport system involved in multi-copper enzyme maturation permease subunit